MPATIIDALVVTLGLDTKQYKKGADEATQRQKKYVEQTKKDANQIGSALVDVGRQAALLFLGFEGVKGALSFFGTLNAGQANLGRFSKNLGESAHEVNTWDSAIELAGGSAKNAEADLMSLSNSLTALKATGEVSPLLLLFQRMGIAIKDSSGNARKLTDLMKDLGDRLQKYNRADAFNLGRQAGLSEDTLNLIIQERGERERLLQLAEQNNTVTEDSVKKAAQLQEEWRGIGQTIKGVAIELLGDITPAVKDVFTWVQNLFTGIKNTGFLQGVFTTLSGAVHVLVDLVKVAWSGLSQLFDLLANSKAGKFLGDLLSKAKGFGKEFVAEADRFTDQYAPSEKKAIAAPTTSKPRTNADRNNPGNLRFAGQAGAVNENGFAAFPTLAQGIQAANRQLDLYAQRGVNTISKIVAKWAPPSENDVPAYIKALKAATGKGENDELSAADRQRLLQGIFNHEGSNKVAANALSGALGGNANALDAARFANASAVPASGGARRGGGNTSVEIGEVNIMAPNARNAADLAAELPPALKRKGVVAQADTGMS